MGSKSIDVVVDNVVGEGFGATLEAPRRGGAYVASGAIAGLVVKLDVRRLCLEDLRLIGSTAWDEPMIPSLVAAIEAGGVRPLVERTYPLGAHRRGAARLRREAPRRQAGAPPTGVTEPPG